MLEIAMLMIQRTGKLELDLRGATCGQLLMDYIQSRHLLRLWLRDPQNQWTTPDPLYNRSNRIYDQRLRKGPQIFPLDPIARSVGKAGKE